MSHLERPPVLRVREALIVAGLDDTVMELSESARTAEDAAKALGCELGAIVKSLVFCVGNRFVMGLVAGDHQCIEDNLPKALNMGGKVRRPQASEVKGVTGFTIGGVAPIGLMHPLPVVLDSSLKRFATVYAAAGHPNCIFPVAFDDLVRVTNAIISYNISTPVAGAQSYKPPLKRSKTFSGQ